MTVAERDSRVVCSNWRFVPSRLLRQAPLYASANKERDGLGMWELHCGQEVRDGYSVAVRVNSRAADAGWLVDVHVSFDNRVVASQLRVSRHATSNEAVAWGLELGRALIEEVRRVASEHL